LPSCFNQHGPGVGAAFLADASVPRPSVTGLMDDWVKSGDQTVWTGEPLDWADRRQQTDRDHHIDPRNGHQPLGFRVGQRIARQLALDHTKIIAEAIILSEVSHTT
jgi:hypothetical protein